jgi:hypothetical protein
VDPDRVDSASFCLIPIGINSKQIKKVDKLNFFQKPKFQCAVQNIEYDIFDTGEKAKTLGTNLQCAML